LLAYLNRAVSYEWTDDNTSKNPSTKRQTVGVKDIISKYLVKPVTYHILYDVKDKYNLSQISLIIQLLWMMDGIKKTLQSGV